MSILRDKYDVRAVFLTMSQIDPDLVVSKAKHDRWTDNISVDELKYLCKRIAIAGEEIRKQCEELNITHFDMSQSYEEQFRNVSEYLMRKS